MRPGARCAAAAALGALLVAAANEVVAAQGTCAAVAVRSPFSGQTVRGRVRVLGSADIDGFAFYKVEYAPAAEPEVWRAVSTVVNQPVRHGTLDTWDTTILPDGAYRLKLTAVDFTGQEPCRRTVEGLTVANEAVAEGTATVTVTPTLSLLDLLTGKPTGPATVAPGETGSAGLPTGAAGADDARRTSEAPLAAPATAAPPTEPATAPATAAPPTAPAAPSPDEAGLAPTAAMRAATGAAAVTPPFGAPDGEVAEAGPSQVAAIRGEEAGQVTDADGDDALSVAPTQDAEDEPSPSVVRRLLGSLASPGELLVSVGARSWPLAFAGGAAAALLLALFAWLVAGLRGRR